MEQSGAPTKDSPNKGIREIIFDTETTGFEPSDGHKLIEIGCIELIDHMPTGNTYHQYINPERDVPIEAVNVHGLTEDFLQDKPIFSQVVDDFLTFVGNDILIAHNAEFDMNFLNYQLKHGGFPTLPNKVIDTLTMARRKFPGSPASLDALCKRFNIDNSSRTYHGALLDSELLAEVYLELIGGRQQGLDLNANNNTQETGIKVLSPKSQKREPRIFKVSDDEMKAHEAMLEKLNNPIWKN